MLWLISMYKTFRSNAHILIPCALILLFCVALWGLNTRNQQLTATNKRLDQLSDSKDAQINQLRDKNDDLADGVKQLTAAVQHQNDVMSDVIEQRAATAKVNKDLQSEIKRYLLSDKCSKSAVNPDAVNRLRQAAKANGVPDSNHSLPANPGSTDSANR